MALIPHKHCQIAIGIQTGLGIEAAGTIYSLPLPEGAEFANQKNYSFFQYAGGHYGLKWYESGGQWAEGSMRLPMIPGYMGAATTDLYDWMFGRSGAATYEQGAYATIYRDMGNTIDGAQVEKYLDCVCTGGTINVDFGAEYAALDLNITGITAPATNAVLAGESEAMFAIRPYRFVEAALELDGVACNITRNHVLTWDNMVEAPADMGVLNGSVYPYALPNNAKAQWSGSFDALWNASATIYDRFIAETESAYQVVLTAAAVATCTIAMPRILYTEDPLPAPADGIVRENGVNFQALAATDDSVDACTISEV